MANEVKVVISGNDDGAKASVDDLGEALAKTKVEAASGIPVIKGYGDEAKNTGEKVKGSKNNLSEYEQQLQRLDDSIASSRSKLSDLAAAFLGAGSASEKVDIRKGIADAQTELSKSTSAKGILLTARVDVEQLAQNLEESAGQAASKAGSTIGMDLGSKLGPIGAIVGTGFALNATPIIGAAISAAVLGGVGIGGIAGGIALAKNDPVVAQALTSLGGGFKDNLSKSAVKWFQGPITEAVAAVQPELNVIGDNFGKSFQNLAPYIKPLAEDLGRAGETISNAIANVSGKAGPVLVAFGQGINSLADGIASFMNDVAGDGPQAVEIINMISGSLSDLLKVGGNVLEWAGKLMDKGWLMGGPFDLLRKHFNDASQGSDDLSSSTGKLVTQLTSAQQAAEGETDAMSDLAKQLKAQSDPVFGYITAQEQMTAAQKATTSAQKEYGKNSPQYKDALDKQAQAAIALTGAAGALGDTFDGKLTPEMKASLEAAGFTTSQINALQKQFTQTRAAGDKFAKKYEASAAVNGISAAKNGLAGLIAEAEAYAGTWTATMITRYETFGKPYSTPNPKYGGLAHGGVAAGGAASGKATSGALTWVGERGPELVSLPGGSTVYSANQSANMVGGGNGPMMITLQFLGTDQQIMQALTQSLRADVKTLGGGSVQRHLGVAGVS